MKVALTLSYDGTPYFGSQIQKETPHTIMGVLEKILKELGIHTDIIASGRTDRGVHATGQVVTINLPYFWNDTLKLQRVLNQMLPKSIHIKNIKEVVQEFHARYSAKKRSYRYIIKLGKSNPFEDQYVTFMDSLALEQLQKNIHLFIGEHDFKNFMKTGSESKSTIRTVYKSFFYKYKGYIILKFQANGFLRSQIRMMVASLLHLDTKQIIEKLEDIHKHQVKPAPANGLYLSRINY